MLLFLVRRVNNAKLKESFLYAVLGGVRRAEILAWTHEFLDRFLTRKMCREGLAMLTKHREAGDTLILVTASPDCYVAELGRRLAFHGVICTHVEWIDGRLSGKLASPNMRGQEKVRALRDIKIRYGNLPVTAYADHRSDLALLKLADHGVLVNGDRKTKEVALRDGIQVCIWRDDKHHPDEACSAQ